MTLVEDYYRYKHDDALLRDVAVTRAVLAGIPAVNLLPKNPGEHDHWRIVQVLSLWQKHWGPKEDVSSSSIDAKARPKADPEI